MAENTAFVAGVREKLEALGFSAASVRPRAPWSSSLGLFWLAALGPVGACLILAQKLPRALQRLLLLLLAIAWLGLPLLHLLRARQLFALLAAVVFPVLGVVVGKKLTASGQVKAAAAGLVALAGGVVVSALLGSWQFALAVWRFAGVKVAFSCLWGWLAFGQSPFGRRWKLGRFQKVVREAACRAPAGVARAVGPLLCSFFLLHPAQRQHWFGCTVGAGCREF